jgi:hypothetical protein
MTIAEFIRTGLILLAVLFLTIAVLRLTDNTEAMATCLASHSLDVCEFTLSP